MKFWELKTALNTNFFTFLDVLKSFPDENNNLIKTQLTRFVKKKLIFKIKKGFYCFEPEKIDPLELSSIIYQPSYLSLETALFYYGLIPDIPQQITSVTPITTKKVKTNLGTYTYSKINQRLFFGYNIFSGQNLSLVIAEKEKALLDYIYLRRLSSLAELRINLALISQERLHTFINSFPKWVKTTLDEQSSQ